MSSSVIDWSMLRAVTDGDSALEKELFLLFIKTAERCLERLKLLGISGSEEEWRRVVHELKGASANIQAVRLAAMCKQQEKSEPSARTEAIHLIAEAYEEVRVVMQAQVAPR